MDTNHIPVKSNGKIKNTENHYPKMGSLYKIAEELGLNHYEFDVFKRIVRCRKKGSFKDDLRKIRNTTLIYENEHKTS